VLRRKKCVYNRRDLLERCTAKLLYGWNDRKFEIEYLRKLERNWKKLFFSFSLFFFISFLSLDEEETCELLMLLSLVPLSCMVAPNRELANISSLFKNSLLSNQYSNVNMEDNIVISPPRGRLPILKNNNSRSPSIISNVSLKLYYECIKI